MCQFGNACKHTGDRLLLLLSLLETDTWGSAVGHGGSFPLELQIASICCEVYTRIIWE
jgi:hypothetical protein